MGLVGEVVVGVAGLRGEGVGVEPVKQALVRAHRLDRQLGGMDVTVHQPWHHELSVDIVNKSGDTPLTLAS